VQHELHNRSFLLAGHPGEIGHVQNGLYAFRAPAGDLVEMSGQVFSKCMYTRRVHEYDLDVFQVQDTPHLVARSLWNCGHDAHFRPEHGVEQSGLARVGASDEGDEAGPEIFFSFIDENLQSMRCCSNNEINIFKV
jgi:hypothetical protein